MARPKPSVALPSLTLGYGPLSKTFKTKDGPHEEKREVLAGHRRLTALGVEAFPPPFAVRLRFHDFGRDFFRNYSGALLAVLQRRLQ
jgi:hypothetical protein